ncbi:AI-2E family transporter [Celeribacter persicus]|jgi:Predicted permease|uniref:Putative PurR-regulated permease PerM n=1 Tax=Celeribacter persicus TaxID=1651082 RepID=A0A2T5HTR0_9RHOB|nr:AI-2E family transporter [Celeribacter persicus]PTQ74916.1 putative PurR-regulated permease PerM [Celeribacter persicus]
MTRSARGHWALIILTLIAVIAALDLSQALLAPFVLAFVCAVVLSPVSAFWKRCGVPPALGALLSFCCVLSLLAALVFLAEPLVEQAYAQIPSIKYELKEGLTHLRQVFRGISDVTKEVQDTIAPENANSDTAQSVTLPSLGDALFAAPSLAAQILLFAGALFFILLSRDEVYESLSKVHPEGPSVACLRDADARVSRYFLTITLINTCFGALVAAALAAIGLPGAMLWGVVAALMNFILYIGPAMVAAALVVAGIMGFDGPLSFAPAATFVMLNMMEGQFVTPTLVGRHMQVNPLLVFLSLCFWLWLWGPVGGFVAIPLLVWGLAVFKGLGPDRTPPDTETQDISQTS